MLPARLVVAHSNSTQDWFQLQWPDQWRSVSITAKELVLIVISATIWGHDWTRKSICFKCDNMAVVDLLKSGASQDQLLVHLLRCLSFYAAYYRFRITATHVPGVLNTAADAISRNNISLFLSLIPQGRQILLPRAVLDLLINHRPNWGSQAWTHSFRRSLTKESHPPPELEQSTTTDGASA